MQATHRAQILVVAVSVLLGASCPDSFAADEPAATAPPVETLKGGVVEIQVTLNDLRDARLAISRLRKSTANLYDEVTRQEVTMVTTPNMVGSMVIMTPSPRFTGQFLPARKKWVEESMGEIGPIIKLFKEDVDIAVESNRHTDVSDAAHKKIDPLRDDAFTAINNSFEIYKQLESLTAGGAYDNNAIAGATKKLDGQMKQLDRSIKNGIQLLQKEAKAAKKSKVASKEAK